MREPLKIMNGAYVVVSNQWGFTNIQKFIKLSMSLVYEISTLTSNSEKDNQMSQRSEAELSLWQKIMKMLGLAPQYLCYKLKKTTK
jgi:hypothetical protein